jgi:hypothetical protein
MTRTDVATTSFTLLTGTAGVFTGTVNSDVMVNGSGVGPS